LIALTVLLVLSMMDLVDYNNEMVINCVYGAFAIFFISLAIQESPLNIDQKFLKEKWLTEN
jgi:hypothetical protein